jgi:hypothetical protein
MPEDLPPTAVTSRDRFGLDATVPARFPELALQIFDHH